MKLHTKVSPQLDYIALHEAGRAVLALKLGLGIQFTRITQDLAAGGYRGMTEIGDHRSAAHIQQFRKRKLVKAIGTVCLAGYFAETLFSADHECSMVHDYDLAKADGAIKLLCAEPRLWAG